MNVGIIGAGKMGSGITRRLIRSGHRVVIYDIDPNASELLVQQGALKALDAQNLAELLPPPRLIWLMLPAGNSTESTLQTLIPLCRKGDIFIDGSNSHYEDSLRRSLMLKPNGYAFLDVGVSGGTWGDEFGFCLMIGGDKHIFRKVEPVFRDLAPKAEPGYAYVGNSGSGHFVKMIHNAIEYGLMQSYAEGIDLLDAKRDEFDIDIGQIARLWTSGSVIRSWLLELIASLLVKDSKLASFKPLVADSGLGRWAVLEAVNMGIPAPSITSALDARFSSQRSNPLSARLLSALRQEFGGHPAERND
ncbi:MAG: decarboxylating 6-phosphogluconate dehydrogenase [SAR202 cluster bacterium]|nr:decarboxylating 6-phosphogluconate dehydrogenase [SAR202 cluster bacterium]